MKVRQQRRLSGLKQVEACTPPGFSGNLKLTGMAAKGKSYERKVWSALTRMVQDGFLEGDLYLGPWFKYADANGPGLAQPDAMIVQPSGVLIIEAKLKQTPAATPQIELYGELAEALIGRPWRGVAAFKFPTLKRDAWWVDTLDMVGAHDERTISNWHYLG